MLTNNRSKRNIKLKYHVDFNTSFAKIKFLNMIFLRKYFNLSKKIYKTFVVECRKQHKVSKLSINVNLNSQYKKAKFLSVIDQIRNICEN